MSESEPRGLILPRDHRRLGPFGPAAPWLDPGLERVRRGAYVDAGEWASARADERYRLKVAAAVAAMKAPRVLSHESAAAVLGLPVIGRWPETKIHVTEGRRGGGRSTGTIVRHAARALPPTEVVDGVVVTSAARTVLDLARTRSFASALVSADHALAHRLCTRDGLDAELERIWGGRNYKRALYVVERVDARSESVGESLSRARMHELNLPMPDLQREFFDEAGFVGRVDFWWEHLGLVGEYDGVTKYHRSGNGSGLSSEEVVVREKLREDRLRQQVKGFVRWTWDVALKQHRFEQALRRAGVVPLT